MTTRIWWWAGWLCRALGARWIVLGQWCASHAVGNRRAEVVGRARPWTGPRHADKQTMIRDLTGRRGFDYGEGECGRCGAIWEAAVPAGLRVAVECPRCGAMAGRFCCLVAASQTTDGHR